MSPAAALGPLVVRALHGAYASAVHFWGSSRISAAAVTTHTPHVQTISAAPSDAGAHPETVHQAQLTVRAPWSEETSTHKVEHTPTVNALILQ